VRKQKNFEVASGKFVFSVADHVRPLSAETAR
jgi:hypothetical protein